MGVFWAGVVVTRADCRGREDCSQEELVILRYKYFLPDCKKKRVPRVDMVAWCSRGSPGAGAAF